MKKIRMQYKKGKCHKEWKIFVKKKCGPTKGRYIAIISWGPASSVRIKNTKIFRSKAAAIEYYDKKVKEKTRKGYKKLSYYTKDIM